MNFNDMHLVLHNDTTPLDITISDETGLEETIHLDVRKYLPINEKTDLIQFVVNSAIDDLTGCFSPVRTEVFFSLGVCKWYAGITFEDVLPEQLSDVYDKLDQNEIIGDIMRAIPEEEIVFMNELVDDTIRDIARYNNSFAGIMQVASQNSEELNHWIDDSLEKIKNKEGIEQLEVIKDVVG